ncbi:MAG: hypothetical protein WC892_05815 [Patescibacteria group bacterium]
MMAGGGWHSDESVEPTPSTEAQTSPSEVSTGDAPKDESGEESSAPNIPFSPKRPRSMRQILSIVACLFITAVGVYATINTIWGKEPSEETLGECRVRCGEESHRLICFLNPHGCKEDLYRCVEVCDQRCFAAAKKCEKLQGEFIWKFFGGPKWENTPRGRCFQEVARTPVCSTGGQ